MKISIASAVAAVAVLTFSALGVVGPSYAGLPADPMAGAPTVGACSTMTAAQAAASSDTSTVVDCSQAHTAQVAGVVQLPDALQWDTAGKAALFRVIAARCLPAVNATLGRDARTRDSSAYDYVWFRPTQAQQDLGARWLSCSVTRPKPSALAPLPTSTAPFLPDGALPDSIKRCMTSAGANTPCAAAHLWRTTGTFVVAGRYPGAKVLNAKATTQCRSRVTAGKPYAWTYRDKVSWNVAHDHVVVCYSRTRR